MNEEDRAAEIVNHLRVEDLEDVVRLYQIELVRLGKAAVRPLQAFLATEGTNWALGATPNQYYPTKTNYDDARRILGAILHS